MKKQIILTLLFLISAANSSYSPSKIYSSLNSVNFKEIIANIRVLLQSVVAFCPIIAELADISDNQETKENIRKICRTATTLYKINTAAS